MPKLTVCASPETQPGMRGTMVPLRNDRDSSLNHLNSKHLTPTDPTWKPSCNFESVMAYSYDYKLRDRDRDDTHELFKSLEFKESRNRSVWMSVAVHGALLSILL